MSNAATAASDIPIEGGRWTRIKRKVARMAKRAAHAASSVIKRMGRGLWRGTKAIGRGVSRGTGGVVTGIGWTLKTALSVAMLIVAVVAGAVVAIITGLVSLLYMVTGFIYRTLDTYVFGTGLWLALGRPLPWSQFKAERSLAKNLKDASRAERIKNWVNTKTTVWSEVTDDVTEQPGDIVVEEPKVEMKTFNYDGIPYEVPVDEINKTYDELGDRLTEEGLANVQKLDDRAEAVSHEVYTSQTLAMPGAEPFIDVIDPRTKDPGTDPFIGEGTIFVPHFDVVNSWNRAIEAGIGPFDFNFSDFVVTEIQRRETLLAFKWMSDQANMIQERSYWKGREEMLYYWSKVDWDPEMLEEHGRIWALINAEYRGRQNRYSLKHMRAGFVDMIRELNEVREKV